MLYGELVLSVLALYVTFAQTAASWEWKHAQTP